MPGLVPFANTEKNPRILAPDLASFQHDPEEQVRGLLWSIDVGVEERFEWQRSELTDNESELCSKPEITHFLTFMVLFRQFHKRG